MNKAAYEPTTTPSAEDETYEEVVATTVAFGPESAGMDRSDGTTPTTQDDTAIMMGAFAAGSCVGCIIGGPILACVMGLGVACGTTCPSGGMCGRCSRSAGEMAVHCATKAVEVNERHEVVYKSRQAAVACWDRALDVNERHKIVERTNQCLASSWEGVKATNEKYKIVDRSMDGMGRACAYLNDKIIFGRNGEDETNEEGTPPPPPTNVTPDVEISQEGEDRVPSVVDQMRKGGYVAVKHSGEN